MSLQQRKIHFYFLNELLHLIFVFVLLSYNPFADWMPSFPHIVTNIVAYVVFSLLNFAGVLMVLCVRRSFRRRSIPIPAGLRDKPRFPLPKFNESFHEMRDGVNLRIRVAPSARKDPKVMLLAAPLGLCGPSVYNPIMYWYGDEYTYVTWDYRGFFGSDVPYRLRRVSIPEHAQDAVEVLNACGFKRADVMVGHSMGVAVSLETVLLFPDAVGSLILINGFHGHVFQTAFQPLVRIPFFGDAVEKFVELLLGLYGALLPPSSTSTSSTGASQRGRSDSAPPTTPPLLLKVWDLVRPVLQPCAATCLYAYSRIWGSPLMREVEGPGYFLRFLEGYTGRLFSSAHDARMFLFLFQELDAHSVWHLLPTITQPVLLISGFFDFVTPAMVSLEMSRRMPHSVHYCDPFSSHVSLLESPENCLAEIDHFLAHSVASAQ